MIVIGLTGSIAMGKSEVARIIADQGTPVFDSDREVHVLYDSAEGAELLRSLAPTALIGGKVDRAKLSRLVLEDPQLLERLETVVHAAVARRRDAFIAETQAKGHGLVVVDVPLLFEKNTDRDVDVTIVVSASEAMQRQRALARPGMTAEKLAMILKRQMPDEEKRRRASHVIENSGSMDTLRARTLAVLRSIKKEHAL